MSPHSRAAGRILVDQLVAQGVKNCFCIPGESYLPVLDALYDTPSIRTITCRHEGGAAMMAEAHGKLTGRPGICLVTRGPGAMNAAHGLHIAQQDSTPMILLVGDVSSADREREAFQEMDFAGIFRSFTKWAARIDDAARIPEYLSRAFHVACSGRPGPVLLALPEDMLSQSCAVEDAPAACPIETAIDPAVMQSVANMILSAERPLLLAGGPGWTELACRQLRAFAERYDLPVAASFRCQDRFDNTHPNYAGHAGIGMDAALAKSIENADLLIAAGPRLGEMTTNCYSLIKSPNPAQKLIHIHPGSEELGRVFRPALAINAAIPALTAALDALPKPPKAPPRAWTRDLHQAYLAFSKPKTTQGDVKLEQVMRHLRHVLPANAIISNGAGNYTSWVHRYYPYRHYPSQLAPTNGSMGYGLPAAIAAALTFDDRPVIAFAGDGCFQMTGQELVTAVQEKARLVVIVVNNGIYGTIRMHQEKRFPGRVMATDLVNPDFAALARACGAWGKTVLKTEDFAAVFAEALACDGPALIELRTDPRALTPNTVLAQRPSA